MSNLVGKNVLIVDEVDDTRTTLEYAVRELEKDVEAAGERLGRAGEKTRFSVFVLHVSFGYSVSALWEGRRRLEGKGLADLSRRINTRRRRDIYRRK